ncbi:uncharacterized protein VTP21DRAFT_2397 [Calcarisporiella thermophila]|uniref:uncharacterized protein n=1 Tax=Calcarisporiella thermophila TaxID=911321 RepID=UPI0037421079
MTQRRRLTLAGDSCMMLETVWGKATDGSKDADLTIETVITSPKLIPKRNTWSQIPSTLDNQRQTTRPFNNICTPRTFRRSYSLAEYRELSSPTPLHEDFDCFPLSSPPAALAPAPPASYFSSPPVVMDEDDDDEGLVGEEDEDLDLELSPAIAAEEDCVVNNSSWRQTASPRQFYARWRAAYPQYSSATQSIDSEFDQERLQRWRRRQVEATPPWRIQEEQQQPLPTHGCRFVTSRDENVSPASMRILQAVSMKCVGVGAGEWALMRERDVLENPFL